ncbi:nucleotidyl transferase AbiEii/AbiGii toxin family protein [Portibacter lacus]|uniref:Nucleotidyltransferase n=1 Tax=Portibacter lacus TaxID=1099794 RepID=A0AA37SJI9_9BACT|nr:nucleotidyl transferase AbiEii/AbiGii toxin family protein [Portibacter lacus]GLR15796.1 nucleotidyltransferase [Portibacter lacus]
MEEWFNLKINERKEIINQTSTRIGIIPTAIEKDFWVMIALKAIFKTEYGEHIVFKGGTSLSKGWNLIERFSEDIDLGIDRSYLNFGGDLTKSGVRKLRKDAAKFVNEKFVPVLRNRLKENGIKEYVLTLVDFEESDTDPMSIELKYEPITEEVEYIKPRILIEISSRSLRDPYELRSMVSFIGQVYPDQTFSDNAIHVPTVLPTRTMLEKIFLLHEEFQKPEGKVIRHDRMTRHLYDIEKLMNSDFLEDAISDIELYNKIVEHRKMITNITWVDYNKHQHKYIDFIPPKKVIKQWQQDYRNMKESMFYGVTLSFEELIDKLKNLRDRLNNIS